MSSIKQAISQVIYNIGQGKRFVYIKYKFKVYKCDVKEIQVVVY